MLLYFILLFCVPYAFLWQKKVLKLAESYGDLLYAHQAFKTIPLTAFQPTRRDP